MTQTCYCWKWSRHYKEPLEMYSEEEAHAAYDARKLYTALIGDRKRPQCFVESNMDYIGVEFLDDHLREHIAYQFQERDNGMLFLSMAIFRRYAADTDKVTGAVAYYYKEDGTTIVDKTLIATNETWQANTKLDVSANSEPYPQFGDYESITRLDRGLHLIHGEIPGA